MAKIKLNSSFSTQATITRNDFQTLISIEPIYKVLTLTFEQLNYNHIEKTTQNDFQPDFQPSALQAEVKII